MLPRTPGRASSSATDRRSWQLGRGRVVQEGESEEPRRPWHAIGAIRPWGHPGVLTVPKLGIHLRKPRRGRDHAAVHVRYRAPTAGTVPRTPVFLRKLHGRSHGVIGERPSRRSRPFWPTAAVAFLFTILMRGFVGRGCVEPERGYSAWVGKGRVRFCVSQPGYDRQSRAASGRLPRARRRRGSRHPRILVPAPAVRYSEANVLPGAVPLGTPTTATGCATLSSPNTACVRSRWTSATGKGAFVESSSSYRRAGIPRCLVVSVSTAITYALCRCSAVREQMGTAAASDTRIMSQAGCVRRAWAWTSRLTGFASPAGCRRTAARPRRAPSRARRLFPGRYRRG